MLQKFNQQFNITFKGRKIKVERLIFNSRIDDFCCQK